MDDRDYKAFIVEGVDQILIMQKWEISCNGWYPYCPVCKKEALFRTPICLNCGAKLQQDDGDMEELKATQPELYRELTEKKE